MKTALTIAGSDSSGGAGIQADLKTFSALGSYGMSVITAITAQNTMGVTAVQDIDSEIVGKQIDAIFEDIDVNATKIGMVSNEQIIKTIAERLNKYQAKNIVLDTVMVSKSGCHLLKQEARKALIEYLIPLAYVVTPNIFEAEVLVNYKIQTIDEMKQAAKDIHTMGASNLIVKGGHLDDRECTDVLFDGENYQFYTRERIITKNTHGTGCTFSAAIASYLAHGHPMETAVEYAKEYITGAVANSLSLGKGVGPTHHFYKFY